MENAPQRLPLRTAALILVALAASLGLASTASAARDPIATGSNDLHMKNGFMRKLSNLDITVQALGSGTVTGKKIGLVVGDGKLDPTTGQGFLEARGGFKLSRGNRGVPVTKIVVNTAKNAVFAQIAKARMQLGTLSMPTIGREGFGARLKFVKLTLTDKAALRISNRLGIPSGRKIAGGRVMSNSFSLAQPKTVTLLPQGTAKLEPSPVALAKLAAKGVKVPQGLTPIAPATQSGASAMELPIAGGTLAADASSGTVRSKGGLQIVKEAKPFSPTMKMIDFEVNFATKAAQVQLEIGPTPPFPGNAGKPTIADVVLPANSVTANPTTRTITVTGAEARLQASAASTINDVFNQPAPPPPPASNFVLGDPLGTFTMTLQAQ